MEKKGFPVIKPSIKRVLTARQSPTKIEGTY